MRPEWIATKAYEARSHCMTVPNSKSRNSECSIAINMRFAALYSSRQELQNETSVDSDKTYEARSHIMAIRNSMSRNSECSIAINMRFAALYFSRQGLKKKTPVDSDKNL